MFSEFLTFEVPFPISKHAFLHEFFEKSCFDSEFSELNSLLLSIVLKWSYKFSKLGAIFFLERDALTTTFFLFSFSFFFFSFCFLYFVFDIYIVWFLRSNKTWLSEWFFSFNQTWIAFTWTKEVLCKILLKPPCLNIFHSVLTLLYF